MLISIGKEEAVASIWSATRNDVQCATPYWNYEDIGIFFLVLVLLFSSVLRLLVRFHLLPRPELRIRRAK